MNLKPGIYSLNMLVIPLNEMKTLICQLSLWRKFPGNLRKQLLIN